MVPLSLSLPVATVLLRRQGWSSSVVAVLVFLLVVRPAGSSLPSHSVGECKDPASCQAHVDSILGRLHVGSEELRRKRLTLNTLEGLRNGILSGERLELPAAQREHLEKGNSLFSEISFDTKHQPVSSNSSHHLTHESTIGADLQVRLYEFMSLKKAHGSQNLPGALMVIIDEESKLSIHSLDGVAVVDRFDLGHGAGRRIVHFALSPGQENHFVITADDSGEMRVHNLKVVARKERIEVAPRNASNNASFANVSANVSTNSSTIASANASANAPADVLETVLETASSPNSSSSASSPPVDGKNGSSTGKKQPQASGRPQQRVRTRQMTRVYTNFSTSFSLPPSKDGAIWTLTSVLPIERGSSAYFVTGDTEGGIAVFHRNGTLKGRVRVTRDEGGVRGLLRGQGQTVVYYSAYSFGFFSPVQIDVQHPPCNGWSSPLFDLALDSVYSNNRVLLALEDGDVLVFSTTRGKSKACDLTQKFPRVSQTPFRIEVFRGHAVGLPALDGPDANETADSLRELFFFNLGAMEAGYGTAPSRCITVQLGFHPRQPAAFSMHQTAITTPPQPGRHHIPQPTSKSHLAIRFRDSPGIELFDMTVRQPPPPAAASANDPGWFDWFPKVGVFGIAMVGVVIWNVRKAAGSQMGGGGGDEFDEDSIKELIKKSTGGKGIDELKAEDFAKGGVGDD